MAIQASISAQSSRTGLHLSWRESRRERKDAERLQKHAAAVVAQCQLMKHRAATTWQGNRTLAGALAAAEMLESYATEQLRGDAFAVEAALAACEHQGLHLLRAATEAVEIGLPSSEATQLAAAACEVLRRATASADFAVHARAHYLLTCAHLRLGDMASAASGLLTVRQLAVRHPFTREQLERLEDAVHGRESTAAA